MRQDNKAIGELIRVYRERKKISREGLAEVLSFPVNHIFKMEQGQIIYIAEFVQLCNFLEIPFNMYVNDSFSFSIDKEILLLLADFSEQEKRVLLRIMNKIREIFLDEANIDQSVVSK